MPKPPSRIFSTFETAETRRVSLESAMDLSRRALEVIEEIYSSGSYASLPFVLSILTDRYALPSVNSLINIARQENIKIYGRCIERAGFEDIPVLNWLWTIDCKVSTQILYFLSIFSITGKIVTLVVRMM